jgi:hypothetical protein
MFDRAWPWEGDFNKSDLEDLMKQYETHCVERDALHIYGVSYDKKYILYLPLDYSFRFVSGGRGLRFHIEENDLAPFTSLEIGVLQGITGVTPIVHGEVFYTNFTQHEAAFTLYYSQKNSMNLKKMSASARFSNVIKSTIIGKSVSPVSTGIKAHFIDTKVINGIEFNV